MDFNLTRDEMDLTFKIAQRARATVLRQGRRARDVIDYQMDIAACHANGTPLRLEALAEADDFNFAHDVFGIGQHLDRETGKLDGRFMPRYARKQ